MSFVQVDNPDETVTITRGELANLVLNATRGEALSGWIATTVMLGHTRPGNTLDYAKTADPGSAQAFVRDFVAWTSGRESYSPGCADRLREWGEAESALRLGRIGDRLSAAVPGLFPAS